MNALLLRAAFLSAVLLFSLVALLACSPIVTEDMRTDFASENDGGGGGRGGKRGRGPGPGGPEPACQGKADGAECQNPCVTAEYNGRCKNGFCEPQYGKICDDAQPCTQDTCEPGKGCNHSYYPNKAKQSCDDGDECSSGEVCVDNVCKASGGKDDGTICDDGNPCTTGDTCLNYQCQTAAKRNDGEACDDGNSCTTGNTCQDGKCSLGTPVKDGTACTGGTCKAGLCDL